MKSRFFKQLAMVTALGVFTAGGALAAVTGKVGHAMPESHPQAAAMNKFVELAAKYTNNNVQLKAFHSAVLGSEGSLQTLTFTITDAQQRAWLNSPGLGIHVVNTTNPPAWNPGGVNVDPSVCIFTSGVRWPVSPKS